MQSMQDIAVFVIVALAASYAAWKLMPRALRARLAHAAVGWAQRRGRLSDQRAAALARRLTASGCGQCDNCGTCSPAPGATAPSGVSELRFTRRKRANGRADACKSAGQDNGKAGA
jgi:hypothetical protein